MELKALRKTNFLVFLLSSVSKSETALNKCIAQRHRANKLRLTDKTEQV
jgi:hypothetical protein